MIGYQSGRNVKLKVDEARQRIAKMIDANQQAVFPEKEITFTSGGTESNYLAMHSSIQSFRSWSRDNKDKKDSLTPTANSDIPHIITTNIEHVATDLPLRKWEKDGLIEVTFVEVEKSDGRVCPKQIMSSIKNNTCLVTVMYANNETGVIQPIAEISRMINDLNEHRRQGGLFSILTHSDAAQVFGKIPLEVNNSFPIDYLSICGHKFYGPRIGALYHRATTCRLYPLFLGGGQEFGRRSGTENTPMVVGLGEAAWQVYHRIDKDQCCLQRTRNSLEDKIVDKFGDKVKINFPRKGNLIEDREYRLPNTASISFIFDATNDKVTGKDILAACDGKLEASTASACHTDTSTISCGSPILIASGISPDRAKCTLRLSVGRYTTLERDLDRAVEILWNAYNILSNNSS